MVTDRQVRNLMKLIQTEKTLGVAAGKTGMDEKTARKWRRVGRLPSETKVEHNWRTRKDTFAEVWEEIGGKLETNPGLQAKTLFDDLQRRNPGKFQDGELRTLQRQVKVWRALHGPPKEVYFPQEHLPGAEGQSDFTRMGKLGVTIGGQPFDHLVYHFVLPYSNWETGTICFSESFESLSEGLQAGLWELGGVPKVHCTDRLTTAVHKTDHPEEFTRLYSALLAHYGLTGRKIQAGQAHELGDNEQRHHRFKQAVDQTLMLRGSRDFAGRQEYAKFLRELFAQLNAGRKERFSEELKVLRRLPERRLEACQRLTLRVSKGSTIRVKHNAYSVDSRLIGERVDVRLYVEHLEIWYAQRLIETIQRQRGWRKHRIQYRHIIDWLVRKPGAFEHYQYREALFPSSHFRMAYDALTKSHSAAAAQRQYLRILELAAKESETQVEEALRRLLDREQTIDAETVATMLREQRDSLWTTPGIPAITVAAVDLTAYDRLLSSGAEVTG